MRIDVQSSEFAEDVIVAAVGGMDGTLESYASPPTILVVRDRALQRVMNAYSEEVEAGQEFRDQFEDTSDEDDAADHASDDDDEVTSDDVENVASNASDVPAQADPAHS